MSFAKIVVSGVLASDPEKRFTPNNNTVTNFTVMVENAGTSGRGAASEPFPVRITCWRNLAEAVEGQLKKGDYILVEGKLLMNSFQAQDGTQKKLFEVEAASIDKLPGRPETILVGPGGENGTAQPSGQRSSAASYEGGSSYASQPATVSTGSGSHFSSEDLLTEDDIPF